MSQNDSGNFEKEFLDSDVDLRIAHPSPGAEIYSRSSGFNLPSFRAIFLFLLLIGGAVGSTYFYAFQQGLEEGQRSLPPVVLAEKTPIKVPAENVPGGVPVKPEDLNIYGVMRGAAEPETPRAQPASPADNATGTIESLIAPTEDPFEQALNVPKAIADDTRLPASNSIRVLQNDPSVEVSPPRPDLNRAPRAAVPAARPTAKPAQTQVRTGSVARDDFMVQLAASRSRALARGVYSGLQNNFSDLLGQRNPLILRVDLGDKGIFYRVNVPGFESRNAATAFCANLKSRGQDCLVRKQP
ncbi:SPOR domain-containing protein [Alphaproteobacteria bacterium]|nr:SPOR domain-containing protein [Alphaproteobacteria bacterium]MDA8622514.1 SPOR domain-containing protein [bacterium]MDA8779724.1 SPOR domain-containing protein [Alphaproteobacteria bacterium]MDA9591235.1 SPOR domain-containing protein [Alphaproteobacteria bacterium]MDB2461591.1 SPOR domain-containing protein [Alphaproteobacteria bacterium]